jgi:thioesterase domain-containing protein/acyl carrier protein
VLNTRGVRLDDDFFALGGNSLLAFRLMSALERQFGRRLPISTLFSHPTIQRLSEAIMGAASSDEAPLLEIQRGAASARPFFFLHGDYLGGGYYCVSLARRLGSELPFYALVPRRIDPTVAVPTIEELAAEHIRQMRAVCPTGPYMLGGFCIGGIIAFEIARQLKQQGQAVALLVLIDAETGYPAERLSRSLTRTLSLATGMPPMRQLAMFARMNQRFERLRELGPLGLFATVLSKLGLRRSPTGPPAGSVSSRLHTTNSGSVAAHQQMVAYLWSACGYHPAPVDASAHLLVSDEQAAVSRDPTVGWGRLVHLNAIHRLDGNHLESITRNLPKLAGILRPLIERAAASDIRPVFTSTPLPAAPESSQR